MSTATPAGGLPGATLRRVRRRNAAVLASGLAIALAAAGCAGTMKTSSSTTWNPRPTCDDQGGYIDPAAHICQFE